MVKEHLSLILQGITNGTLMLKKRLPISQVRMEMNRSANIFRVSSVMRTNPFRVIAVLLLALPFSGVTPTHVVDATLAAVVEPLSSPAGANSSEPQFTISRNRVILSWVEVSGRHTTLKFAESTATGWSVPKTAASGNDFFINSADVPAVRVLDDGTSVAQWLQRSSSDPDSDAYNIRLSWSKDGGQTWSPPTSPHHDRTKTQHGFVSLFEDSAAGLDLVWLDGRATDPETESGDMSLRAAEYDSLGKQRREVLVAPRVCDCCATAAAETAEGPIIAYRNRSSDEIRDIYVTRLLNGQWTKPVAVHDDGWRIDACPINGPAISAKAREVAVAWFTGKNDRGQTFVAFSNDAGRSFGAPIRMDETSSLGRVGVQLLDDGSAAVTWVELTSEHSLFRTRTITPSGVRSAPVTISNMTGGSFPRVARRGDALLFAWTETIDDSSRVKTARLRTPLPGTR